MNQCPRHERRRCVSVQSTYAHAAKQLAMQWGIKTVEGQSALLWQLTASFAKQITLLEYHFWDSDITSFSQQQQRWQQGTAPREVMEALAPEGIIHLWLTHMQWQACMLKQLKLTTEIQVTACTAGLSVAMLIVQLASSVSMTVETHIKEGTHWLCSIWCTYGYRDPIILCTWHNARSSPPSTVTNISLHTLKVLHGNPHKNRVGHYATQQRHQLSRCMYAVVRTYIHTYNIITL